jgi:hypothetical protein
MLDGCCILVKLAWKREHFVHQGIDTLMLHATLHNTQRLNEIPRGRPVKLKGVLTIPT